jgi:hypothetical protein
MIGSLAFAKLGIATAPENLRKKESSLEKPKRYWHKTLCFLICYVLLGPMFFILEILFYFGLMVRGLS